jgi:hypothetical protein
MFKDELSLEVATLIGQPINTQLPTPYEISLVCDVLPLAKPGELVYKFSTLDETADVILDIEVDGTIQIVKRGAVGYTLLTFKTLESKLEHVYVEDFLQSVDTNIFARRNASITRGMDKAETKILIDGILAGVGGGYYPDKEPQVITPLSGEDLYDWILAMKHAIEDYGDTYVLLAGSRIKEKIDLYKKEFAEAHNYDVDLAGDLTKMGITVHKGFGKVCRTSASGNDEVEEAIIDSKKAILVATNSRIAEGKPIKFLRRQISPEIAKLMGAEVDNAQRAIVVNPVPVIDAGANKRAIGVYGMESFILAITNPYAISTIDLNDYI